MICSLCGVEQPEVPGVVPGELDLHMALHRIGVDPGNQCTVPMPKQKAFFFCDARFAAIAGGFRSSKTVTACSWQVCLAQRIPKSVHFVGRLNKPSLEMTTMTTWLSLCPGDWVDDWQETKGRLTFRNGSIIWFKHLDITDADLAGHIRSLNLTSFLVDQSEEISEGTFNTLIGRLSLQTDPLAHFGRLVLNPAGQDWNWRRFFDSKRKSAWQKNTGFVVSTLDNQQNLPSDYLQNTLDNYPEDWAQRFIYGSFADFSDLVYKDFSMSEHVYDSNLPWPVFGDSSAPPAHWPVVVGVDIGGVDPWALVFIAIQPETGFLYLFDEIYEAGILVRQIADKYHAVMRGRNLEGLAYDYENQQAALELGECDIGGSPAIKEVLPGVFKVGQYLHPSPRLTHPFNGGAVSPRLFIGSHCENSIRELGALKWAKDRQGNLTGKPADGNDHCPDAIRYAIHTFRPEPITMDAPKRHENSQLDSASRLYWHRVQENEDKQKKAKQPHFLRNPFHRRNNVLQR